MNIQRTTPNQGIALIMVLIVIAVLSLLAGNFATSMRVETKLARNASFEGEMEWLGRSGIELARYILAQDLVGPNAMVDCLNQYWAGGPGDSNNVTLAELPEVIELGKGKIHRPKIIDLDRKININAADEMILRQALTLIGVDAASTPTIIDSILDWRDPDDSAHMNGVESEHYEAMNPPYIAKNGPIDDLSELLLINGITPAMYWGPANSGRAVVMNRPASRSKFEEENYWIGLVDLFTPMSSRLLNVNTASATTLQVIPEIDENFAQLIIEARAGPDGVDGTYDDMPFRSPADLMRVHPLGQQLARYFTVKSLLFEARVQVEIGGNKREYIATLRRQGRDIQILNMSWR